MDNIIKTKLESFTRQSNFLESENYLFYRFLSRRRLVLFIFKQNYFELLRLNDFHDTQTYNDRFWNREAIKYRWKVQKSIIQKMSNYLSSLSVVVEFSRKELMPVIKTDAASVNKEIQIKDAFLNANPEHKFIVELRNAISHHSPLLIASEYDSNNERNQPNIIIYKNDLLKYSKWSPESLEYLNSLPDKIYPIPIFKRHFENFLNLQSSMLILMLSVDLNKIYSYRNQFAEILTDSEQSGLNILPFNQGYIKYLDTIITSAKKCLNI